MKQYVAFILSFLLICSKTFSDDWNGTSYAQNSALQLSHAERLLQSIIFKDDEKILD